MFLNTYFYFQASKNLVCLSLKALINENHVSILDFLHCCKKLQELILDKCSVHFPHPDGLNSNNFQPHKVMKKLHVINKNSPFLSSRYMTLSIARLIPNLEELVLRPEPSYVGFTLNTIKTLSLMPKLERLEVPVSTDDSVNNMPSFVYVLREFPALRCLTLAWGASPPEINHHRTHRMVNGWKMFCRQIMPIFMYKVVMNYITISIPIHHYLVMVSWVEIKLLSCVFDKFNLSPVHKITYAKRSTKVKIE